MKTTRAYKVKLNGIALYDCETIEHAQKMVQGMRNLAIDSTLFLSDDEIKKLLSSKGYKITINKGNKILERYNIGMFGTYINSAFNRYITRLNQAKGA